MARDQKDMEYIRSKLLKFFIDCGFDEDNAKGIVGRISDDEACRIYDEEDYFEENGY